MKRKVLYVVNSDSTTSIPLEVGGYINLKYPKFKAVVYYAGTPNKENPFLRDFVNLQAKSAFDFKALFKVIEILRIERPQVVHAHHTFSAFVFFLFARIFLKSTKLIKTEHNNHTHFKWYQNSLNFFTLLFADKVLCNSKSTMESYSFIERRIALHKSEVAYNGVNLSLINAEDSLKANTFLDRRTRIIGSVGRLIDQKDYATLIRAFNNINKESNENLELVIIGDGKNRSKLKELVKEYNLEKNVTFPGVVNRTVVFSFLNEVDVFVMSSLWEGFCNTLVEALAAEKAVVCSDISTLKEVAGDAALFAKPGDANSFSKQIKRLLADENLYQEMKMKAKLRAQKFSLKSCADRYTSYY